MVGPVSNGLLSSHFQSGTRGRVVTFPWGINSPREVGLLFLRNRDFFLPIETPESMQVFFEGGAGLIESHNSWYIRRVPNIFFNHKNECDRNLPLETYSIQIGKNRIDTESSGGYSILFITFFQEFIHLLIHTSIAELLGGRNFLRYCEY